MTRTVIPAFRWLLGPSVVLAIGASASLYLRPDDTDEFFAWTIQPPLTAALLGAAFGGTLVLFALALRETVWANARIVIPAPLTLSTLLLIATLIHLDKFHLDEGGVAAVVAWIWLVVYIIVPPVFVVVTVLQLRAPGGDPLRSVPAPSWLRGAMLVYGGAAVIGGAILFVIPEEVAPHWPWAITPLTGRAVAAWLVGLGVAGLQAVYEADFRRLRAAVGGFSVIGGLGLLAVARFSDDVDWDVGGWMLVGGARVHAGRGDLQPVAGAGDVQVCAGWRSLSSPRSARSATR